MKIVIKVSEETLDELICEDLENHDKEELFEKMTKDQLKEARRYVLECIEGELVDNALGDVYQYLRDWNVTNTIKKKILKKK